MTEMIYNALSSAVKVYVITFWAWATVMVAMK